MNNIYSMQKQMGDISRKILGKNQKEMVKIKKQKQKNTVTEIKNAFNGLLSRPNTAEKMISELEDISIKSLKKKSREDKTG